MSSTPHTDLHKKATRIAQHVEMLRAYRSVEDPSEEVQESLDKTQKKLRKKLQDAKRLISEIKENL